MAKYKVLSNFTFRGAKRKKGDILELSETKYEKLKSAGLGEHVETVKDVAPVNEPASTPKDSPTNIPPHVDGHTVGSMQDNNPTQSTAPAQPAVPNHDAEQV